MDKRKYIINPMLNKLIKKICVNGLKLNAIIMLNEVSLQ